jgi:hypothetical protein
MHWLLFLVWVLFLLFVMRPGRPAYMEDDI